MSGFETYLFLKLDDIRSFFGVAGFILLVMLLFLPLILPELSFKVRTKIILTITYTLTGVMFILIAVMTPTTKEAMIIYAVPTISEYVKNSKELKELPDNVVKTANEWVTNFRPDSITTSAKEFIQIIKTKP